MNGKRIVLGGMLAGVFLNVTEGILNAVILMDDYESLMETHQLTGASWAMAGYLLGNFVFGLVLAWLYAAIRPRFGPGWKTGVYTGTAVFLVAYLVPSIWFSAMGMGLSSGMTVLALVWGLVEMALAGVIAGWVYQEEAPAM
jgi:MFS family permease